MRLQNLLLSAALCLTGTPAFPQNYSCSTFSLPKVNGKAPMIASIKGPNKLGQIAGNYYTEYTSPHSGVPTLHGFVREAGGALTFLRYPGAVTTSADGIDDLGEIVGTYQDCNSRWHIYLRRADGTYIPLSIPMNLDSGQFNVGGLNNNGALAVDSAGTDYEQDTSGNLLFYVYGTEYFGFSSGVPAAINDSGQVLLADPTYFGAALATLIPGTDNVSDQLVVFPLGDSRMTGLNNGASTAGFWENNLVDRPYPLLGRPEFAVFHPADSSNFPSLVCPDYPTDGFANQTVLYSINDKNQGAGSIETSNGTLLFIATPTGTAPSVQLSQTSWDFGSVPLNHASAIATITVTNNGNGPLHIPNLVQSPFAEDLYAFTTYYTSDAENQRGFEELAVTSTTCSKPVAPGQTCSISFQFKPTQYGAASIPLILSDDSPTGPHIIPVSGFGGTPQSILKLSNTSWTFSAHPVGQTSGNGKIYIYNEGTTPVTTTGFTMTGTGAANFKISASNCGSTLIAYRTCSVTFDLTPLSVGGHAATLNLNDDSLNGPIMIPINGDGK